VLELPQGLGLDLPDTLAGHREFLPDFFERVARCSSEAKAASVGYAPRAVVSDANTRVVVSRVGLLAASIGRIRGMVFD